MTPISPEQLEFESDAQAIEIAKALLAALYGETP
jgi:hypothetical protein